MKVAAWGYNGHGGLGLGEVTYAKTTPTPTLWGDNNKWVSAISFGSMVQKDDGTSYAVGGGLFGQRCDGTKDSIVLAPRKTLLPAVAQIAVTGTKGVAVLDAPGIATWGTNLNGTLADGEQGTGESNLLTHPSPVYPVLPTLGTRIVGAAIGYTHGAAVLQGGGTIGWGTSGFGQVGAGNKTTQLYVVHTKASRVKAVACGWQHTLYLKRDGTVWHVGNNAQFQSGFEEKPKIILVPAPVPGITTAVAIATAGTRCQALLANGDLIQWGEGELPHKVLDNCTAVSVGCYQHLSTTLAIRQGEIWAWGHNGYGQIGDGSFDPAHATAADKPDPVAIGLQASVVAAGETHSLALA